MINHPSSSPLPGPPQMKLPPWVRLAAIWRVPWLAYVLSAVLMLAILLVPPMLGPTGDDPATIVLLTIPIILSAVAGGLGAGLAVTMLAALLANYFLLPPVYSFSIESGLQSIQWLELIAAGVLISVFCEGLHRARRHAEASQKLQAVTLASIGDAVITTDAYGRITLLNAEAERLTGWQNQEVEGQPSATVFRIAHAQTRAPLDDPAENILRARAVVTQGRQIVLLARNGGEVPIDISGAPITHANGVAAGVVLVFRDVSTRRQIEAAQARLAAIVESSDDAIIGKDLNGIVTSWNAGAERIFGYAEREMVGQSILMIIPPNRSDEETTILSRIRRGERVNHFETVRQHQNGTLVDVSVTVSPIRDSQGHIIGASKVARDISARKRAETALQESEERFRNVFMSSPAPELITHLESRQIVDANPAFARMAGYDLPELIGQTTEAFGFWPDSPPLMETRAELRQSGLLTNREIPIRTRDGGIRDLLLSVVPVELDGAACFLTVMLDQTDRKRAEVALQNSAERLHRLADASYAFAAAGQEYGGLLDLVARVAADVLGEGCINGLISQDEDWRYRNGLYDVSPEKLILMRSTLSDVPLREDEPSLTARIFQTGQPMFIPIVDPVRMCAETAPRYRSLLERVGMHSMLGVPMRVQGRTIGALIVYRYQPEQPPFTEDDLSLAQDLADRAALAIGNARLFKQAQYELAERTRTELELRVLSVELEQRVAARTAELEATNKELEAFSYSVSHDLRAPLRAIDGFTRILLDEYVAVLPDEAQRYFKLVRGSAQQMGHLIDDLLAFSRLGRQPLKTRSVDMTALVRQCWNDLSADQANRAIEFQIGALPASQGDPTLLKQVWINLLANALKYSRRRAPAAIEVGCQATGGEQIYWVRDNGVGFDMRYGDKLFGVFQRLHRAEDYEGTGVGLAIVQRIVHRHGGRVWAESEVGQGAVFYFTLGGASI